MHTTAAFLLLLAATASPHAPMPVGLSPAPLGVASVLGAWRGDLLEAGGHEEPIEASFADGARPGAVVGHFTLARRIRPTMTVRRLGQLTPERLVFDLRDGGHVALRLREGRLVGDFVDLAGQLTTLHAGTIDLTRLRPAGISGSDTTGSQ
jgi:hypothetical protein